MTQPIFVPPSASGSVILRFPRTTNAPRLARNLVWEWFRHWNAPEHVAEASELITSELVTNAVGNAPGALILVRIRWSGALGYVEVWDANPTPPIIRQARDTDLGGRGLALVASFSSRLGYYPAAGGKVVWAELSTASQTLRDRSDGTATR